MITIRRRLLLLLLPALAILMLIGGVVDYWIAVATTRDAYDRALANTAVALTANIRLDKNCGLKHGIYAVRVGRGQGKDQQRFDGVASFGRRPTFDNGAPLLEVFLFDFKGDLYGNRLDVAFIGFIRDELKFDSIDALIRQMDDDSTRARAALAAAPGAFPKFGTISSPG